MEDKYNWSGLLTKILINEYESKEFLYNPRHADYKNRSKRLAAYKKILNILNARQKGLQLKDLKRKISGLRSQYLSEKLKVTRSLQSGVDADSIYKPTVYWYPLLKFLDGSNDADNSNLNETVDEPFLEENNSSYMDYGSATSEATLHREVVTPQPQQAEPQTIQNHTASIRKRKCKDGCEDLLAETIKTISKMRKLVTEQQCDRVGADDEFTIFGKFVACELREVNAASDRILYRQTKRRIQEVLLSMWDKIDSLPCKTTRNSFKSESSYSIEDNSSLENLIIDDENLDQR